CTEEELFELSKKAELMESNSNPNLNIVNKGSPKLDKASPLTRSLSIGKKKGSKSEKKKGNRSPVKLRNAVTIDQIISDDDLYKKLHDFMKGALIEETLDFYKAVSAFKNSFDTEKKEDILINLQMIYNVYISVNSERPVSFSTNSFVEQNIKMIES